MQPAGHGPRNRSPEPGAGGEVGEVHPRLSAAFAELDDAGVRWCLLRGRPDLADPSGDVDLLIDPSQRARCQAALDAAGFVIRRRWDAGTQTMYLAYDDPTDRWMHLHVVGALSFGPDRRFRVPVEREVLSRVVREGGVPMPDPADRFVLLLLHAALDKGRIADRHREQLQGLVDGGVTDRAVLERFPAVGSGPVVESVRDGRWMELERIGRQLPGALASRGQAPALRGLRNRAELTMRKLVEAVTDPGFAVALLAPDGAGKSTLADGLVGSLPWEARAVHLGLYRATDLQPGVPGIGFAVRLARSWGRGLGVRWHRARRRAVILDRHPMEALVAHGGSLRTRLRNGLLGRSLPTPDLTLVLDAPAEVLHRRRPEHSVEQLLDARARYRQLAHRLPNVAILDATRPPDQVRRAASASIWRTYRRTRR